MYPTQSTKAEPSSGRDRSAQTACVLIGIGSRLGSDDAIGLALVEKFASDPRVCGVDCHLWEHADFATLTLGLLDLPPSQVVIVDCADMGLDPGAYRLLQRGFMCRTDSISVHGLGLAQALDLAQTLGGHHDISVFGIQPYDLSLRIWVKRANEKSFCQALPRTGCDPS